MKADLADIISSSKGNADSLQPAGKGFQRKHQRLCPADGKLQARRPAVVTGNLAQALRDSGQAAVAGEFLSNDQSRLVIDASEGTITATNAQAHKTGKNFVPTWHEELQRIC